MAASPPVFDLQSFVGVFKRVLSSRLFDSLAPGPDSNVIVAIDRVPEEVSERRRGAANTRRYRWSFGPRVESTRTGYIVEVLDTAIPPEGADQLAGLAPLRVQFQGRDCYGMFQKARCLPPRRLCCASISGC